MAKYNIHIVERAIFDTGQMYWWFTLVSQS